MQAHRMRLSIAFGFVFALSPCKADSLFSARDWGVACLNATTGELIWEYFPNTHNYIGIATDGTALLLVDGPLWGYMKSATPDLHSKLNVTRIDLQSGQKLSGPSLPLVSPDQLTTAWPRPGPLITASGDLVVGGRSADRAITVMKGSSNTPKWIISVGRAYNQLFVHGDTVIYVPTYWSDSGPEGPTVVAVDTMTNQTVWTVDNGERALGVGLGSRCVFVCENQVLRALDVETGREIWQQQLPRLRNDASVHERDGRVFVAGKIVPTEERLYYLYCLDPETGRVDWTYDPGGITSRLPLLFHNGMIYTRIAPTSLIRDWRGGSQTMHDRVIQRFASKSPRAIELHLRSWHSLGDRSAMALLEVAAEGLSNPDLAELAAQLIETFPTSRKPMALVEFLSEQFDCCPELRVEIGRILYQFDPIPHMHRRYTYVSSCVPTRVPFPKFPVRPEQLPLLETYNALKTQVDAVPVPSFTYDDLQKLAWGRGFGPFESLVAAHDAAVGHRRREFRHALFRQHPAAASDWALQHVNAVAAWKAYARERNAPPDPLLAPEYSPSGWVLTDSSSLAVWADHAPMDWLLAHQNLLLSWLQSENRGLLMAVSRRISELEDPTPVLEISVKLLEAGLDGVHEKERGGISTAMQVVAKSGSADHIPLLKVYADGSNFIPSLDLDKRSANQTYADYQLRRAATAALRALGANVPDVPTARSSAG